MAYYTGQKSTKNPQEIVLEFERSGNLKNFDNISSLSIFSTFMKFDGPWSTNVDNGSV